MDRRASATRRGRHLLLAARQEAARSGGMGSSAGDGRARTSGPLHGACCGRPHRGSGVPPGSRSGDPPCARV